MTFIGVDGEAIGQGTDARYVLLCTSLHREHHIYNPEGLRSWQIFDFLCAAKEQAPKGSQFVGFGTGYDVNQWLRDLRPLQLQHLWEAGSVQVGPRDRWRVTWRPNKTVTITDTSRSSRSITVQETFGFFQSSFVKACQAWDIDVGADMQTMKIARGTFTAAQLGQVIDYCHDECDAMAALMGKLRDATDVAGCTPKPGRWFGAGQLASELLERQGVAAHHRHDLDVLADHGDRGEHALMCAYFGGRSEMLRQGVTRNVVTYDLNSAYPAASLHLPSLLQASVRRVKTYKPDAPHALWRCRWADLPGALMPFPVRVGGEIYYPRSGEGWYHAAEVAAARAVFGDEIRISGGYIMGVGRGRAHLRPFHWVPTSYAQRAAWKAAGNPAEKALKLALNSLYGKTAQGLSQGDRLPKWQSYFWAGEITARTRASMFTLAARAADPIMIATDGLFLGSAGRLKRPPPDSTKLGGWGRGHLSEFFCAKAGVYSGLDADGNRVLKTRGFFSKDVDLDAVQALWEEDHEASYHYRSHRFIGLGRALQSRNTDGWERWLNWYDEDRSIHLVIAQQKKVVVADTRYGGFACLPVASAPGDGVSEPYVKKGVDPALDGSADGQDNDAVVDQPLRNSI